MGHPPLYVIFSICPSIRPADWPSVTHNISIVGTHVQNDDVWVFLFFHFFKILIFGAVMKNKRYMSRARSQEQYSMIMTFDISRCFFHFSKILIFWVKDDP